MKYMAACSFGKDSIATVILAKEHNEPLDEVVYCEVMFDDEISGEVPEHRQFIYETAKPIFESWGYQGYNPSFSKDLRFKLQARYHQRRSSRKNTGVPALWTLFDPKGLQTTTDQ